MLQNCQKFKNKTGKDKVWFLANRPFLFHLRACFGKISQLELGLVNMSLPPGSLRSWVGNLKKFIKLHCKKMEHTAE